MKRTIAILALLSTNSFAGNGSGWGGSAVKVEVNEDVSREVLALPEIDLSNIEMLNVINHGLIGKSVILERAGFPKTPMRPIKFDFQAKTVELQLETGESILGREVVEP